MLKLNTLYLNYNFMKKFLLVSFLFVGIILFSGCAPKQMAQKGEVDLKDPELNPSEELYSGKCLVDYGTTIAQLGLDAGAREWIGYHKLVNQKGKVPTRMSFSADGNIKMYTKPMKTEDWQLVKDFKVDRMRVNSDDKNIDDIIKFPKAKDYCLMKDTEENSKKDFPCITLYPEGMPIKAKSPFNIEVCVKNFGELQVKMLNHDIFLHTK